MNSRSWVAALLLVVSAVVSFGFAPMRSRMEVAASQIDDTRPRHLDRRTVHCPWIDLSARAKAAEIAGGTLTIPPRHTIACADGREITISPLDERSRLVQFELTDGVTTAAPRRVDEPDRFAPADLGHVALTRTADGTRLLCLVEERTGDFNTLAMSSDDEGRTWSSLYELPASLTGTGHRTARLADDRLVIVFRDGHASSPTRGDIVAWIGTDEDVLQAREGALTCRLFPGADAAQIPHVVPGPGRAVTASVIDAAGIEWMTFSADDVDALAPTRGYTLPIIDLDADATRQVVVDREDGQYLGHPTTCLFEDNATMLCVYPKGHGRGGIVFKRSADGGRTWSTRLPTPESWATSREVPTLHRLTDPITGRKRLIMWSGLYPARLASSEDDGATWTELTPVGNWGGIVVMGFVERLANGSYLAMFHDDGRFFTDVNRRASPPVFTVYKTFSHNAGRSWSPPEVVWTGGEVHLCEPGCIRSPDGTTLAVLMRENSRRRNSYVSFSTDEGATWSPPRELPASLTGDRHTGQYAPDGRLFISFRDTTHESPTKGDWVGWVGTWDDIATGREGQYRVRLKDNHVRGDCAYPGVEVLPDGTFVVTTYGHWEVGAEPYILSVRFRLEELDARMQTRP